MKTRNPRETGNTLPHEENIKKSYRKRGKQHRTQINNKQKKNTFKKKHVFPKKTQTLNIPKIIHIPYSHTKIKENIPPPYSTLKPETSSDSPSEKSKGERLASARHRNTHLTKKGKKAKPNQNPN